MTRRSVAAWFPALLLTCLPALAASAQSKAPAPPPVEGVDYVVIADGRPWQPLAGRIEVVEVFAYTCHHCHDFQALVDRWKQKLPRDVRFGYVPAAFNLQDSYARAYFAAEALDALGRTHHATFDAIHRTQALPARGASVDEIAGFYSELGIDAARLKAAMASPATDAKMNAARDFAVRSGIEGTPTVIINGIYRVQGRTLQDILRITDALIAQALAQARSAGTAARRR